MPIHRSQPDPPDVAGLAGDPVPGPAPRVVDVLGSPRAGLYAHYRRYQQPMFTLCCPVALDVGRWKAAEGGLFLNVLYAVLEGVNAVPELRQRIRVEDGRDVVVEHARVDCTCTVARDDGSFSFCPVASDPERGRFVARGRAAMDATRTAGGLDLSQQGRDDLVYVSSVPWMEVTGVVHAMSGDPDDCVPRLLWGRAEGGRMTLCATAHHSLVDGLHLGRFFAEVARRLA